MLQSIAKNLHSEVQANREQLVLKLLGFCVNTLNRSKREIEHSISDPNLFYDVSNGNIQTYINRKDELERHFKNFDYLWGKIGKQLFSIMDMTVHSTTIAQNLKELLRQKIGESIFNLPSNIITVEFNGEKLNFQIFITKIKGDAPFLQKLLGNALVQERSEQQRYFTFLDQYL
ncbi:hypothetical protein FDP41_004536 [Naegleria fowleri]|uniref:Uncharacterized protein n=1 Tax=Naegleria fowleri TaxID=5763 RepID=A0A6A5BI62_NAEFO|nr:uncharacterized protein FDP41_004536 [Naegleria fowleri]KAF0976637.1 hypothetical protein FDP41_004536 [Naegleria fowleri]